MRSGGLKERIYRDEKRMIVEEGLNVVIFSSTNSVGRVNDPNYPF